MVTWLHVGDTLTNRLDNTSTLVSQNDGESALGVFSRESVCVFLPVSLGQTVAVGDLAVQPVWHTPV